MKLIVAVVLALVAVSYAVDPEPIKTIRSQFQSDPQGAYNFGFETENGIKRDEQGELRQAADEDNKPHDVVVVRGSFSYTNPDGNVETINYYADETGYHAEGPSIPVAPVV